MRIANAIALGALLVTGAGCGNYLSGPGLGGNDPNSVANIKDPGPLYVGLEAGQMQNYTSQFARFVSEFTQQIAGVARQQQGFDLYVIGPSATDGAYSQFWGALPPAGGGGSADARKIETIAQNQHDSIYVGIAQVWRAMIIGDAASVWGAVPYSQAYNVTQFPTPKYDDQLTVFAEVEATLDSAIAYLKCKTSGATNLGPTGILPRNVPRNAEVIYAGLSPDSLVKVYTEVAHSLKARYYLMQSDVDPSNYAKALTEAQLGIADPSHDWTWYANVGTALNQWVSFQGSRGGDIGPGAAIINLMKARILSGKDIDNGRFGFYFLDSGDNPCVLTGHGTMPDSGCTGYRPGGNAALPGGGGNSDFNIFNNAGSFRQPAVTYTETQLIIAEAELETGNGTLAKTSLNNVRSHENYGADALDGLSNCGGPASICSFAPQPALGAATLQDIIEEKYIDLFATPVPYADYKRTCLHWLSPAPQSPTATTPQAIVPGRLPYGQTAIASDPNTPNVGATARNADQPTACPQLTYTSTPAAW